MKIKKYYTIFLLSALFTSCSLVEEPISDITDLNFWKTASDATAGVNGIYNVLAATGNNTPQYLFIMGDVPSDIAIPPINAERIQINNFATVPSNSLMYNPWQRYYQAIGRANVAIEKIPGITMDETLKNRLVGEAKFLRALYYFYLVRYYGDVPLVLTSPKNNADLDASRTVTRTPIEQVYTQIVKDFTDAEGTLLVKSPEGRATVGAAKAFLAKVYLTRKQFPAAKAKAKEVIDNKALYGYDLFATYADVFKVENKNGKESVFEIQHRDGLGTGNGLTTYLAIEGSNDQGRGFGSFYANPNLVNAFQTGDQRKNTLANTAISPTGATITAPSSRFHIRKFVDPTVIAFPNARNNYPIIRYADVLLMYAEASMEVDGPTAENIEMVNMVRRRAFGFPITTVNVTSDLAPAAISSQANLRDAIYNERRLELFAEGHRWLDLVRTGRLVSTIQALGGSAGTNIAAKHNLFPIPQRERDANPSLTQNPGY
jgi:hypothetical protein